MLRTESGRKPFQYMMQADGAQMGDGGINRTPNPLALPHAGEAKLTAVTGEAEQRALLLQNVTVDLNGVGHCLSPEGNETQLAFVAIEDLGNGQVHASLLPLRQGEDGALLLPVPVDRKVRIGVVTGFAQNEGEFAMALRAGDYPGVPLTTREERTGIYSEIPYNVAGIRLDETLEAEIARQIDFATLGFNSERMRIIINISDKPQGSDWVNSEILVDAQAGAMQVLLYQVTEQAAENPMDMIQGLLEGFGISGFGDESEGESEEFREWKETVEAIGQDFGISQTAKVFSALEGAFTVQMVPSSQ